MAISFRPPGPPPEEPLWAAGDLTLQVWAPGARWGRTTRVRRPFATIGRGEGADIRIGHEAVGIRHVYLHLDARGLFACDLASRTGTRVGGSGGPAAWLGVGESLELAGHRVELLDLRLADAEPGAWPEDPLADAGAIPLTRLVLEPASGRSLGLTSALAVAGRSPACGVRVEDPEAAKIHGVFVRSAAGAFLVDLGVRPTRLGGRPLAGGAAALRDGQTLTIASARFACRVGPTTTSAGQGGPIALAATAPEPPAPLAPAGPDLAELLPMEPPPLPPGLPAEAQAAVLGWMLGVLQAGQQEMLRRQESFQRDVADAVARLHQHQSEALDRHYRHVESIHEQLSSLRDEVRHRFGPAERPPEAEPRPALAAPQAPPLKIHPAPPPPSDNPAAATAWLLERVSRLDQENRSAWRELLGRLSGRKGS